jgi:mitogen-activated protein kinase kinase kinase
MLNESHEEMSPGPATATLHNSQFPVPSQGSGVTSTQSHRHNASGTSLGALSTGEASAQWPIDRVTSWLAKNGFSKDWQETFRSLDLQGADFLELGQGANGRANLSRMHQVVYPQLAKECHRSGTGWDQAREREEGKRMRKLVRQIHDDENVDTATSMHRRRESQSLLTSASTEGGVENSPNLGWDPIGPFGGGTVDNNYSQHPAHRQLHAPLQKQSGQLRSVTAPITQKSESGPGDPETTSHMRSEYSRSALANLDDVRRQSPSSASEGASCLPSSFRPHEDSPQSGSPATQYAVPSGLTSSSTGDLTSRYEHSRGNSTDSIPGRGTSTLPRFYEGRKQTMDNVRPATQDSKESGKSLLSLFRKKAKSNDSSHPSPEEQLLDSPTSPVFMRQNGSNSPFIRPAYNTSDMSLGERPLSASFSDYEKGSTRGKTGKTKRYVFATLDGWNYRLVDVTNAENAENLRAVICQNLGINDWPSAQVFLTEPGQTEHEESLNDSMLTFSRKSRSDPVGSLKFFVRGVVSPNFTGLGVSFPEKNASSPISGQHHLHRKPLDEDALARISPQAQVRSNSPLGFRQSTLKASSGQSGSHASTPSLPETTLADASQDADLMSRQEEYRREVERKQNAYFKSKQPTPQARTDIYGDTGYRSKGVIDFDMPRHSPFEDKKHEILIPLRKPPSAPAESNTLTKVNSLSKRPGDRGRVPSTRQIEMYKQNQHASIQEEANLIDRNNSSTGPAMSQGIVSALASVGQLASSIGTAASVTSQSTFTSSDTGSATSRKTPSSASSISLSKPTLQNRKSFGPEYDFEESTVAFEQSQLPEGNSDADDSDDGLFAIPLSTTKNQSKSKQGTSSPKSPRPSLTVNTSTRASKGLSVTFKSPSTNDEHSAGRSFPSSAVFHPNDGRRYGEPGSSIKFAGDGAFSPKSSDDERNPRRQSIVRDDIWASRPPVEGVIDHLDDFFPNIDLDEPYLEATATSPPESPAVPAGRDPQGSSYPSSSGAVHKASDILGSNESTLKSTVAQRNINRAGGLSRMKSIREVAKGAHQVNRNQSTYQRTQKSSGDILRRKSTKMFGAKIMQISPKPGSRLSQLDPIPQNSVPQENIPKRQQTFRIIRGQLIGKGTYGRVYLGINADTGEVLAVKQVEVNARIAGQDKDRISEMVAAMDQEIDTMQHLEHPHIVQYLGFERGELSISIYLEYISGGSIGSCLRKHGKFEESVVKSLTRQVLSGLAYLHDQGILHRDLKADNILLDLDGTCKISDFGISKKTDNIYGNDASNSMQGSVFWMAPEVVQSQGQGYSAKVDIWSLGCVVLEMFAGRRPWSREEAIGAIFKLGSLSQAPPIPEDVAVNISPAALAFMYDCFTM